MFVKVKCVKCPSCSSVIWSRNRHDFRSCSCKKTFIDGGRDYLKYGSTPEVMKDVAVDELLLEPRDAVHFYSDANERLTSIGDASDEEVGLLVKKYVTSPMVWDATREMTLRKVENAAREQVWRMLTNIDEKSTDDLLRLRRFLWVFLFPFRSEFVKRTRFIQFLFGYLAILTEKLKERKKVDAQVQSRGSRVRPKPRTRPDRKTKRVSRRRNMESAGRKARR